MEPPGEAPTPKPPEGDRTTILLHLYERQNKEVERREGREQQLFEWLTGLLLAAFGAIIALSDRKKELPHQGEIKFLTTILILAPVLILAYRLWRYSKATVENAAAIDRIEELLHVFDSEYFGGCQPYPEHWEWRRVAQREKRKTPYLYLAILFLMTSCVIASAWLLLGATPDP